MSHKAVRVEAEFRSVRIGLSGVGVGGDDTRVVEDSASGTIG